MIGMWKNLSYGLPKKSYTKNITILGKSPNNIALNTTDLSDFLGQVCTTTEAKF